MAALSNQYTGFKLYLNDNVKRNFYVENFTINEDTVTLYSDWLDEVEEAYLFAPPGYWKTVNNDDLFPDDYPLEITTSINGGTSSLSIKTNVVDGLYEYFLYYNDEWTKFDVVIKDNKIAKLNVTSMPQDDGSYGLVARDFVLLEIDVNQQHTSDLDTTLVVAQIEANNLDTELVVKVYDKYIIPTNIFVQIKNDLLTELYVNGHADLSTEIYACAKGNSDLTTEIYAKAIGESELLTEITVAVYDDYILPIDMLVCHMSNLPTELTVIYICENSIDTFINIQRVDRSSIFTEITVKRWGEDTPIIKAEMVVVRHEYSVINTSIEVLAIEHNQIDIELNIPRNDLSESIPTNITIIGNDYYNLPTYIMVANDNNKTIMETAGNIEQCASSNNSVLLTTVDVVNHDYEDLITYVYVYKDNVMETSNGVVIDSSDNLETNISVVVHTQWDIFTSIVVNTQTYFETTHGVMFYANDEISTDIVVKNIAYDTLLTTLVVDRQTEFEAIANLHEAIYNDSVDIPTDLTVKVTEEYRLFTSIEVVAREVTMETVVSDYKQLGNNKIGITLAVAICDMSMLPVTIDIVSAPIIMETLANNFIMTGQSDIVTEVQVVYNLQSELETTLFVNPLASYGNIGNIINYNNNDLPTTIILTTNSDLYTYICVSNETYAPILATQSRNVKPTIVTRKVFAKKDSYNYNFTPLTNYGKRQYMDVAYTKKNDIINSIVGFDFNDLDVDLHGASIYYDYQVVQKATLYLYKLSSITDEAEVKVYSTSDTWYESSVNYNNLKKLNFNYLTSVPTTTKNGWVTIDITEDLQNFEELDSLIRSYKLTLETKEKNNKTISFATLNNDDESLIPYVEVTYYHTLDNCNWLDVETDMYIKPYSDLETEVTVNIYHDTVDMPTELEIIKHDVSDFSFKLIIDVTTNIINADLLTELDMIFYPCDELGPELKLYIPAVPHVQDIETILIVVRHPEKEAYVYMV